MLVLRSFAMFVGAVWLVGIHAPAHADDRAGDRQAIRQRASAYRQALTSGHVKALTAFWTAEGKYVDAMGRTIHAHELFTQRPDEDAADVRPVDLSLEFESSIRFLTPDVAIEEGTTQLEAAEGVPAGNYAAIWVKKDGVWMLERVQEWGSPARSVENPLKSLEWMIGNWVGRTDEYTVECSSRWTDNQKFIVRRFTIEHDGQATLRSTQRIGWDPAANRIRSWTFDSDGGIVEGRWQRDGNSWIVKCMGVLPNGTRSTAINFWISEGSDHCVLHSSHVVVGQRNMDESTVEFRRRATPSPDVRE